jgi:hypothetical protein
VPAVHTPPGGLNRWAAARPCWPAAIPLAALVTEPSCQAWGKCSAQPAPPPAPPAGRLWTKTAGGTRCCAATSHSSLWPRCRTSWRSRRPRAAGGTTGWTGGCVRCRWRARRRWAGGQGARLVSWARRRCLSHQRTAPLQPLATPAPRSAPPAHPSPPARPSAELLLLPAALHRRAAARSAMRAHRGGRAGGAHTGSGGSSSGVSVAHAWHGVPHRGHPRVASPALQAGLARLGRGGKGEGAAARRCAARPASGPSWPAQRRSACWA